jgi:hypothetical protein
MSLILLVFGILIAGAGVVAIGFGWTVSDSALGQSFIISGAIILVGGPLLMGVASLISQLRAIAETLRLRPLGVQIPRLADARQPADSQRRSEVLETGPRLPDPPLADSRPADQRQDDQRQAEPRASDPRPAAEPTPATAIDVSDSALERLRSTVRPDRVVANGEDVPLSPNGNGYRHGGERKTEPKLDLRPEPEVRLGGPAETRKEPRLDFLFRPKAPAPPPQHQEQVDAMWPRRRPDDQAKPDEVARQPPLGGEVPRADREARSLAILKSGVVDGMAYTLYADGSIEAQLPHGTVRFGSIAELRAHIENNS